MKRNILIIVIFSVLFWSCSPSAELDQLHVRNTTTENISGTYYSNETSNFQSRIFWNKIIYNQSKKDTIPENSIIQLRASKSELSCSLIIDGKVLRSVKLKGHFKNGYFVSRKSNASGIYGILWRLEIDKLYFGMNNKGSLITIRTYNSSGFLTIIPFPLTGYEELSQFQKSR